MHFYKDYVYVGFVYGIHPEHTWKDITCELYRHETIPDVYKVHGYFYNDYNSQRYDGPMDVVWTQPGEINGQGYNSMALHGDYKYYFYITDDPRGFLQKLDSLEKENEALRSELSSARAEIGRLRSSQGGTAPSGQGNPMQERMFRVSFAWDDGMGGTLRCEKILMWPEEYSAIMSGGPAMITNYIKSRFGATYVKSPSLYLLGEF